VLNPAIGQVFAEALDCSPVQLDHAMKSAQKGLRSVEGRPRGSTTCEVFVRRRPRECCEEHGSNLDDGARLSDRDGTSVGQSSAPPPPITALGAQRGRTERSVPTTLPNSSRLARRGSTPAPCLATFNRSAVEDGVASEWRTGPTALARTLVPLVQDRWPTFHRRNDVATSLRGVRAAWTLPGSVEASGLAGIWWR
jgi:hypothetical protein